MQPKNCMNSTPELLHSIAIAITLVCFEPVHAVSRPSSSTLQTFVLDQSALRTVPKWVPIHSESADTGLKLKT